MFHFTTPEPNGVKMTYFSTKSIASALGLLLLGTAHADEAPPKSRDNDSRLESETQFMRIEIGDSLRIDGQESTPKELETTAFSPSRQPLVASNGDTRMKEIYPVLLALHKAGWKGVKLQSDTGDMLAFSIAAGDPGWDTHRLMLTPGLDGRAILNRGLHVDLEDLKRHLKRKHHMAPKRKTGKAALEIIVNPDQTCEMFGKQTDSSKCTESTLQDASWSMAVKLISLANQAVNAPESKAIWAEQGPTVFLYIPGHPDYPAPPPPPPPRKK